MMDDDFQARFLIKKPLKLETLKAVLCHAWRVKKEMTIKEAPEAINLDWCPFWVQMHGLLPGMMTEKIGSGTWGGGYHRPNFDDSRSVVNGSSLGNGRDLKVSSEKEKSSLLSIHENTFGNLQHSRDLSRVVGNIRVELEKERR
ncbi:hypothetical protein PTKIN_Ptkin10aG0039000 [Pterospermum kingtungense]